MTQKVPSLFRDSSAPSVATDAASHPSRSADPGASDAAKEARLLSQLLLLFSVKRQHSAVAALFPRHIESSADGQFAFVEESSAASERSASVSSHGLPSSAADASGSAATVQNAHVHPATDAALASSLLRTRPSERELVQQFLLLPQASRNKVAQSLFVVPPSLLDDFAVILQFFLRVAVEAHSDSPLHHYDRDNATNQSATADEDRDDEDLVTPTKTCSWARNGDSACVAYEPDESQPPPPTGSAAATPVTTAVFSLPPGFHACLIETYGSVQRSKCEEVWHGDHMAYRCRTCGLSDSSCMCLACFDPQDHEGHDYRVYRCSSGGCCDCGDPLAWKPEGFCKKHRKQAAEDETAVMLGALEHAVVHGLVRRVIAFCMNVLKEVYAFCLRPSNGAAAAAAAASPFDAYYHQSQTMRSLPKTGRRRSSFPSVMQVHLDRLQQCLAWLQAIAMSCVPYRQIVTEIFLESLPPDFQLDATNEHHPPVASPSRPLVILDVFLKAGVLLPVGMCDTLGVLYLKLLFDQSFKQQYTCHFVDWYPYFIELYLSSSDENNEEGMRNLSRFIDRLFCQLFHSTAQLRELERAFKQRARDQGLEDDLAPSSTTVVERLLILLLEKLIGLFKSTLRVESVPARGSCAGADDGEPSTLHESIHVVDTGRNVFKKRVYARLCSDIRTLLVHPLVAGQVLLSSFEHDGSQLRLRTSKSVYGVLIQAYEILQQMDMQQRHVQQHIEFESQNWTFAFVVDYEMNLLLGAFLAGLPYCFPGTPESATIPEPKPEKWEIARALVKPLRGALLLWSTRNGCGSWQSSGSGDADDAEMRAISGYYEVPPKVNGLTSRTSKKNSFHLPLHHMFAAVLQGVCSIVRPQSLDDWKRLLFNQYAPNQSRLQRDEMVFLYQVTEHPLRVATLVREIKAGLWVRNGNVMWQQLIHYYAKHWRFFGLHGDIFVSQLSALLLPRGSVARVLFQQQLPLLAQVLSDQDESAPRHEAELLEEMLRLTMQLVLSPLRFPSASHSSSLEDWTTWMLEREMKHWLSLGPFSRSEVVAHLDMKLVEQVRQQSYHEWYLLEEEEIVSNVLERVGEYDDPCGVMGSSSEGTAAAALGFGMKMSGTWRLKSDSWREISPLFECFSPAEAQQCEQNLKKQQLRSRMQLEEACLLSAPRADENGDYFASAQALASQVLNSPTVVAVVMTVLRNWVRDERVDGRASGGNVERRAASESLLVAAMQCLSIAAQLLDSESTAAVEDNEQAESAVYAASAFNHVEKLLADSKIQDFYAKLCVKIDGSVENGSSMVDLLSVLSLSKGLSPDTKVLAQSILRTASSKSRVCDDYIRMRNSAALDREAIESASSGLPATTNRDDSTDKERLAKEMMRRRQQEILEKMRSQQQKFLSSQYSKTEDDDADVGEDSKKRSVDGSDQVEGSDLGDEFDGDDDDDEACLSTEYEEEDEDEDDEWGFPTGHIDLELYFSHLSSAVSQISDRERRSNQKNYRRLRRRTQSKQRADSLGGPDVSASPSLTGRSEQDEDADAVECALCRLPCEAPSDKDSTFGYVAMVQPTSLPTKLGTSGRSSQLPPLPIATQTTMGSEDVTPPTRHFAGDAVVWSCGHPVHHSCIKAYVDSLWKQQRSHRNPLEALHHHGDDRLLSERDSEFQCPVCRRLSNCLLPDVQSVLRPRLDSPSGEFSLLHSSSSGEEWENTTDGIAPIGSRNSFSRWLKTSMQSTASSPFSSPMLSSSMLTSERDVVSIVRKRMTKFCKQLKLRSVRAALQLPLLLSGSVTDELVVNAEIRDVTESWGEQFCDWQLLLRCLEVELDVTLYERDINGNAAAGSLPDRHRRQSLRLLAENTVAAALTSDDERVRGKADFESIVATTSEVLFGRRVLFAEDDDEVEEVSTIKRSEAANVPLLSHPDLFAVFSKRLTSLQAVSAARCASTSDDYRYTSELLSDVLFTSRVVVTAQILQALCSSALSQAASPSTSPMSPRSPASKASRQSQRSINDFSDVETLNDAMQWVQQLMVRCRLLPPPSVLPSKRVTWDMGAIEDAIVDHVLPLLRRIVLLIQASLPRVLDGTADGEELCALCDELFRAGNAEFTQQQKAQAKPRTEMRALLRRLHLPPLRLFFRRFVFSPMQRELCQLWAAQMESKAAVLRRHEQQQQQHSDAAKSESSLTALLVPTSARPHQESRRLLIDLPKIYMDLFIKYNDKPLGLCERCHQVPQHPAICLFCGDVLCCFSACCESTHGGRIGECTQHAQSCGLGTGAFLLLRACTVILFLGNERRCVWGSLYVDKNGEEDPYLRRGKTLFLAPNRLLALETLLVSHGFTQNTAILANTSRRDGRRY